MGLLLWNLDPLWQRLGILSRHKYPSRFAASVLQHLLATNASDTLWSTPNDTWYQTGYATSFYNAPYPFIL